MHHNDEWQRAMLAEQVRHNAEMENSIGCALIFFACLLAPAAILTGLYWLAGLGFIVALCAWSALRSALLLVLALLCYKLGEAELGWWLFGAGALNSFVAQWRCYGWDALAWYGHREGKA